MRRGVEKPPDSPGDGELVALANFKQGEAPATRSTPPDTVTIASLLPGDARLELFHIEDLNPANQMPIACEFITGKAPNNDEPALTHGVPRWFWEAWEEQNQNNPVVRDRLIYALPYPGQAPFEPDMDTLAKDIRRTTGEEPSPTLLVNLRDVLASLASHIAAVKTASEPAEVRESLREIRESLDKINRERRQKTRAAILGNARGSYANRVAGGLYKALDDCCTTALPRLSYLEERFANMRRDEGGVKPISNKHGLTAEQTCGAIGVEVWRIQTGQLPKKRKELPTEDGELPKRRLPEAVGLCRAVWAAAGGEGIQDWFRPHARAVDDQQAGRADWIRKELSRPRS
jgi:hypothetical protein